jgi:hypothetical protein
MARATKRKFRPHCEGLEGRALLSFLGSEHLISTTARDNTASDNASSVGGTSVVVWQRNFSSTDHDIFAQRFDKLGNPLGAAITIENSGADTTAPRVSLDGKGRFVVAWTLNSGGTTNIFMQEFNWNGNPLTGQVQVTSSGADFSPDVAAANGSFVIAWNHSKGTDLDVQAERFTYNGAGQPVGKGVVTLPDMASNSEISPSVAMSPAGRYDIAYIHNVTSSDADVWMARYDGTGKYLGTAAVNVDSNLEYLPSVSMDSKGNVVVAYQEFVGADWDVRANRVSSAGVVGGPIVISAQGGGFDETDPAVALAPTGGLFVVAYDTPSGVQVTEMSATDTKWCIRQVICRRSGL